MKNKPETKQQKTKKATKAGRHRIRQEETRMVKSRKQQRHERNVAHAAEERTKGTFQVPPNAMVELASLPAKARDKIIKALPEEIHINKDFTTGPDDDKQPIMVPDPMRGKFLKGAALHAKLDRREESARRINTKAAQRRRFASLSPKDKAKAREKGTPSRTKHA